MEDKPVSSGLTIRDFIKTTGAGVLATMGLGQAVVLPGRARAADKVLKILQWSHFVPRSDKGRSDGFARRRARPHGVDCTAGSVRAQRHRSHRCRPGGRKAARQTASLLHQELVQSQL